jgi:CubicO group peptidase (beta-lactamase class C family)
MAMHTKRFFSLVVFILFVTHLLPVHPAFAAPPHQSPDIAPIIEKYRQRIEQLMDEQNIAGLAIAIVDDQQVLWSEGFGYTDTDRRTPVDTSTLFSIQSMSKSFTATAVMMAVQEGLVDLDAPITEYLPDFHVNSIFEEHPEQKMTLRMLLAHTAGFTHEAPIGSNYDRPNHTFEEHIASISDTWLLFPVGARWQYSNLGIDLAGYIVQVRSGMPFTEYVRQRIYMPLGMDRSAFATPDIRKMPNRAIGHVSLPLHPIAPFLLLPAGGVYTTADDLSRYLIFHINRGAIDGQSILRTDLADELYTIPFAPCVQAEYALGLGVSQRNGARIIGHGGGGFGFLSQMFWYPELKLGGLLLTNSATHTIQVSLIASLLDEIIATNKAFYGQRLSNSSVAPIPEEIRRGEVMSAAALARLIKSSALEDTDIASRYGPYTGTYAAVIWGFPSDQSSWLRLQNGSLYKDNQVLTEVQPGLFFDPQGEALDLRGGKPTYRNIPVVRLGESKSMVELGLLGLSALLFLSALLLWPVRAIVRRIRRATSPRLSRPLTGAAWLSALSAVLGLMMAGALLAAPELRYVPWPAPYIDFQWWANAIMLLPHMALAFSLGMLVLALVGWRLASTKALPIYLVVLSTVMIVFNIVMLV